MAIYVIHCRNIVYTEAVHYGVSITSILCGLYGFTDWKGAKL